MAAEKYNCPTSDASSKTISVKVNAEVQSAFDRTGLLTPAIEQDILPDRFAENPDLADGQIEAVLPCYVSDMAGEDVGYETGDYGPVDVDELYGDILTPDEIAEMKHINAEIEEMGELFDW